MPKLKAAKAAVKKCASHPEEEPINMKLFVRAVPNIFQECLNNPHWKRAFFHTLSHALYVSDHPFTDWTLGSSTLLETIQVMFDISFTTLHTHSAYMTLLWKWYGLCGCDPHIANLCLCLNSLMIKWRLKSRRSQVMYLHWWSSSLWVPSLRTDQKRSRTIPTGLCGLVGQHITKLLSQCLVHSKGMNQTTQWVLLSIRISYS